MGCVEETGVRLSVIIPARDAGPELSECLGVLTSGSGGAVPEEIIVVDDGSSNGTAGLARAGGARVLRLDGRGPAAARNAGARAATGDILIFIDADCVPERDCIRALTAPFGDPAIAGVRGAYTSRQRSLVARFAQLELEEKQGRLAASRSVAVMDTACAAYRRSVFLEHGGFDERYPATSAEDVELSFRLVERGARLVFAPSARVRHRHPERLGRYLRRKVRFGYYRALLYGRYPARLRDDGYTPRLMPLQIALTGLTLASGALSPWARRARPAAVGLAAAFIGTTIPLASRAWATDRTLAVFVPALLFGRSSAQGLGLMCGLLAAIVAGPWRR